MSKSWRTALMVGAIIAVFAATSAGAAKFITGADIKNGSIGLRDISRAARRGLKGQPGPAGAPGPAGPQGAAGPQGPAGPGSISTTVRSQSVTADGTGIAIGDVHCPAGMVATGGSVWSNVAFVIVDRPTSDGAGWTGVAAGDPGDRAQVFVICTPGTATVLPTGS
ncbi:MAG TPA: hypothetical protein VKB03_16010 [Conexibacter sp.]|nr:hypothetical protein [Conexibacter sp.]